MFEKYWGPEKEEFSDRDPNTLVGWPENYSYIADCSKIIDIGCGIGNVVEWLNNRGHNSVGLTCQQKEVDKAQSLSRDVLIADMHTLPFFKAEFDAFIMWDSLEHSIAPLVALMEARRITRNGGKGMLFIPGQNWIDYGPHIIVPTQAQMKHLLKLAGMRLIEVVDIDWGGTAPEQAVYKVLIEK